MAKADDLLIFPGTVVIDSREQLPYAFRCIKGDFRTGHAPLLVNTVIAGLPSGDYSLVGLEGRIAVERKSLEDAFGTFGRGRRRFELELERLSAFDFAAVVVEATWEMILCDPPMSRKLTPKTIFRSVIAWQQRFTKVHWWMVGSRNLAERVTFRILERYYRDHVEKVVK